MGQFSMEIYAPTGSLLSGNLQPDVLDRVQLWTFSGQSDDADVAGHDELAGRMPTSLIHQHDRVSAGCDHKRDLGQMQGHGFGIAEGQHQPGTTVPGRNSICDEPTNNPSQVAPPMAHAASIAVKCWRISPGFSRPPRTFVIWNG